MPSRAAERRARRASRAPAPTPCVETPLNTTSRWCAGLEMQAAFGRVDAFGGCPLHVFGKVLAATSLYDCYCLLSTSRDLGKHVIALGISMPVAVPMIQASPEELFTRSPVLNRFLSILLEYHLPHACQHSTVLCEISNDSTTFACESCGDLMRYKPKVLALLSPIAFATVSMEDQALRRRVFAFNKEAGTPNIGSGRLDPSARQTFQLVLKDLWRRERTAQLPEEAGTTEFVNSSCSCAVCRRREARSNVDFSDDDGYSRFGPRAGRRKSRKGTKVSFIMETCQHESL